MDARLRSVLPLVGWGVAVALALLSWLIFLAGLWRDERPADPVLTIDVARPAGWTSQRFRVWGGGDYKLFLSTVNWDSTRVGTPLLAPIEVQVVSPRGEHLFARSYGPGETGLTLPLNYGDAPLADLRLDGSVLRRYALRARVLAGDARFAPANAHLKLHRKQFDPGMGGMINYVMILPATVFTALAFVLALSLLTRGRRWPLAVSALALFPILVHLLVR